MKKLRIYLDTSVINFLYADDAPEKRDITIEFFHSFVEPRVHDCFVSSVVIAEIDRTEEAVQREMLLNVVRQYRLNEALGYLYPLRVTTPLGVMGREDE